MSAHEDLRALAGRGSLPGDPTRLRVPGVRATDHQREAAVLVLLGVLDDLPAARRSPGAAVAGDLDVLLVERASSLRAHPGQIAFPGGRVDPQDAGVVDAALREAEEETGLDPAGVELLGTLPPLPLPVSNHLVTPVLGWWAEPGPVRVVDTAECAAVFRMPVADLLAPTNRFTSVLHRAGVTRHRGPAFQVAGTVVWGFTAYVLDAMFDALGWTEPWDDSRLLDITA